MLAEVTRSHAGTGGRRSHGLAEAPPFRWICVGERCLQPPVSSSDFRNSDGLQPPIY
uniref:Uncharacterized protein n=1 Tax=Ficus carica TaxID=3494 RepID=A0AA88JDK4_FICCA|nr:hypothetical protein TIFTF001_055669 [Ficus carica]GMN72839.1 hypothetical protein TIFTF001_055670 [Ficus carica]